MDPLAQEWILIPHPGFKTWLEQRLALELGVWSQGLLLPPREALWRLAWQVLPEMPAQIPLEPEQTVWLIYRHLEAWIQGPEFALMRDWLAQDPGQNRPWQLAQQLAQQLDLIASFRPDWLEAWEKGGGPELWAAPLWRQLRQQVAGSDWHRGALQRRFCERLRSGHFRAMHWPVRLSLFAVDSLPPLYLEMLLALAEVLPVTLYLPDPLCTDCRHPLLERNGQLRQLWFQSLARARPQVIALPAVSTAPQTRLQALQQSLRSDAAQPHWPGADASLQIHAAHSPLRELEILKDLLYTCFQELEDLQPGEVAVILPELPVYAPLIAGVFQEQPGEPGYLPWALVETQGRPTVGVRLLRSLFALSQGRLGLNEVLALLEQQAVARAFALEAEEIESLTEWLVAVEIRWGRDARHREQLGLPAFGENSWLHGLRRLLLGVALPDEGQAPWAGILPYDAMEGQQIQILGKFLDFMQVLETLLQALQQPQTLSTWAQLLQQALSQLCRPAPEAEEEWESLLALVSELAELESQMPDPVRLNLVQTWLESRWDRPDDRPLPLGRICFGPPEWLQGLPFRVICLLGLNAGTLPRREDPHELSLLALEPRPADPSLRRSDRAFFLQTLCAARDRLILSYLGQRVREHGERQPAVLIAELQDYLEQVTGRPLPVVQHALHPFANGYFSAGSGLPISWSRQAWAEARALQQPRQERHFCDLRLPPPCPEEPLDWRELCAFFRNPAAAFLWQRLGLRWPEQPDVHPETERFELNGLELWHLREELLSWLLRGGDANLFGERLRASEVLPPGPIGERLWQQLQTEIGPLARQLRAWTGPPLQTQTFELCLAGWQLQGEIQSLYQVGWVDVRLSGLKARDYLNTWLQHLLLGVLGRSEAVFRLGLSQGQLQRLSFAPVAAPEHHLQTLIALWQEGLCQPLPLALESAWAWFQARDKGPEAARRALEACWRGQHQRPGEAAHPAYALCLDPQWWLRPELNALIEAIFIPLQSHLCLETLIPSGESSI